MQSMAAFPKAALVADTTRVSPTVPSRSTKNSITASPSASDPTDPAGKIASTRSNSNGTLLYAFFADSISAAVCGMAIARVAWGAGATPFVCDAQLARRREMARNAGSFIFFNNSVLCCKALAAYPYAAREGFLGCCGHRGHAGLCAHESCMASPENGVIRECRNRVHENR